MNLTRVYKNAAGTTLRTDTMIMNLKRDTISRDPSDHTFERKLKTEYVHGPADRTVASLQITGDYTSIETSSGHFLWAKWTNPVGTCDMSDLPRVGDTV